MNEENIFELPEEDEEVTPTPESTQDNPEEGTEEVTPSTSEGTTEAPKPEENEDNKFLEYLNTKEIKYNGEKVTVKSMDDLISTYQKGMNYDKLKAKTEETDDTVMAYINEKAKAANLTPKQYIEEVKAYEKRKEQEAMEADIKKMVSQGLDEALAREVAETKLELQKMKEEELQKKKEDEEYERFIQANPEVKPSDIPAEVFQEAKEIGLNAAYLKYENKLLKEKLDRTSLNQKNLDSSVVTKTTDGGGTEQKGQDDFERALFYK